MVLGDFNTIRLQSEAFGGAPNVGDMEEFDMAIREADLVEPASRGTGLLGLVRDMGWV